MSGFARLADSIRVRVRQAQRLNRVDDHQCLGGQRLDLVNSSAIDLRGDLLATGQLCEILKSSGQLSHQGGDKFLLVRHSACGAMRAPNSQHDSIYFRLGGSQLANSVLGRTLSPKARRSMTDAVGLRTPRSIWLT
jgi:hypothetical protein